MVNKKGKGAKTKGSKPPTKKNQQDSTKDLTQQSPQERVALVRPYWETLSHEERVKLLTIDLEGVRARAKQLAEAARQQAVADAPEGEALDPALLDLEPSIEDVLAEGIKRLTEKGTWKLWQWPADNTFMYEAESFRQHITDKHIREELRRLLPREEGRVTEKPAEAAFRQRMMDLLAKVQQTTSANSLRPTVVGASGEDGASRPARRRGDPGAHLRDANIELLAVLLEALAKENDHLYHSLLTPITTYVMEILPEGHRETTKLELSFEDLENLLPDDVSRIVEWLTEKVDALSTKLKPELKDEEEDEEENMGDVDLWSLSEENTCLTVNGRWLQHLQDRLLGEDGHPRRAKAGEDPGSNGLVLEWVYGSIVSTAEKSRDGAKRPLGMQPPSAADAHLVLVRSLEEHLAWETRAKQCKDLLSEMLKSRLEAADLTKQGYDLRPQPRRELPGVGGSELVQASTPLLLEEAGSIVGGGDSRLLPDDVILFMLRREALLTRAKLHFLVFEHLTQEKELRILKQALRQGEPEFERLKRELDEVKHQPRGMDGAYRSAAEMERHRHQVEVQTAFREQGARLQATYDKKQKAEYDMAKRETEIKQLQGWKGTVENLVDKFQELINSRNERLQAASGSTEGSVAKDGHEADGDLEAASGSLTPQQYIQLTKLRNHFTKDVRKQLYGDADDRAFFDNLKSALKAIERRLEDSSVVLQHLEMQLINVACDDPGAIIGSQLALPLLQDRLDQRGLEYAAKRAKLAEDEVLRMELLAAEREAAERERKKAAKAKKNEKAKSEKERLAAERQAKEEAERAARVEAERERTIREEEDRRKRIEAMEAMRKAEEAAMEMRRKELLSDENGYWRQRMIMEERLSGMGMAVAVGNGVRGPPAASSSPELSEELDRRNSSSPEDVERIGDDDEGFVTESRRRRHKDTRDQDEEVAAPASASTAATGGARGHPRSASRDRMGRDGMSQRERGEQHTQRDREPRRHQTAAGHRNSTRDASGGRQGAANGGPGQHAHRQALTPPLAATPAATPKPQQFVDVPTLSQPQAAAEPSLSALPSLAHEEASELPVAPASASPSGDLSEPTAAAAEPTSALPSPSATVPEDAILFGDIPVIPMVAGPLSSATQAKPANSTGVAAASATPVTAPPEVQEAAPAPSFAAQSQQPSAISKPSPAAPPVPVAGTQPQLPPQAIPASGLAGRPPQDQGHMVVTAPGPTHGFGASVPHGCMPPHGPMPVPAPPPPQMLVHMPPNGHNTQGGGPRPQGPGVPAPQFMHVNGGLAVPLPTPGAPMPPMAGVLPKQMSSQQMGGPPPPPPPPPATILLPLPGHVGSRPPMPVPGMPGGPPPPGVQAAPPPQPGMQMPPPGSMPRQPGPMPQPGHVAGMAGPGPQGGLVQVPHPPAPGQPQHGPAGAGQRGPGGPQGQAMMMPPMQFGKAVHGSGVAMSHGQVAGGPMGHVPPGMYVFPGAPPGMVPPGPHGHMPPHVLHVMPGSMPMPMGGPPSVHMQAPPHQPQQQGNPPPAAGPGPQPPPPPKSPSTGGGKPGSTLNANARSFVPSAKVATLAPTANGQQPQQQQGTQQVLGSGPSQPHRPQYQRQNSGGMVEGAMPMPPAAQLPGPYIRGGPAGSYGGQGQQPVLAAGPYIGRRDRRDLPRGNQGVGGPGAGVRKGPGMGPAGTHGPPHGDMQGASGVQHPAIPQQPINWVAAPIMVGMGHHGTGVVPVGPPPAPNGLHLDSTDATTSAADGQAGGDAAPSSVAGAPAHPMGGVQGMPQLPPPSPAAGHGQPYMMPPPPPPGVMPPGPRYMLVSPSMGMPGPTISIPTPIPVYMPPGPASAVPGMNDGSMQKNVSAAESVRAPQLAQSNASPACAEAEAEDESRSGRDSAAVASAEALHVADTSDGDQVATTSDVPRDSSDHGNLLERQAAVEVASEPEAEPSGTAQEGGSGVASTSQSATNAGPAAMQHTTTQVGFAGGEPHAAPSTSSTLPITSAAVATHETQTSATNHAEQQLRQASGRVASAGSHASRGPSAQTGPLSWSSVAARREANSIASSSGYSQEAFPSLVPSSGTSAHAPADGQAPAPTGPVPFSWKAKLQQNVPTPQLFSAHSGPSPANGQKSPTVANGMSYGSPAGARGCSPRGTLSGGVPLASSLSDSAIAHSNGHGTAAAAACGSAAPVRLAGNRPSGSALLVGPSSQLPGNITLPPLGADGDIAYHPAAGGQPRQLHLVRGLQNLGGQHNCFLNVTIQSLWHLHSFREAVLQLNADDVAARGAAAADVAVLRALVDVFRAMAASPSASATGTCPSWVVSPLALREALSTLETGQSAVRLDLSEMHDAFEVLLVLLSCMHRAEAGSGAPQGQDPQLPRRMRMRDIAQLGRPTASGKASSTATGTQANGVHLPATAVATVVTAAAPLGYAAAVSGGAQPQRVKDAPGTAVPCTVAHSLFGLEVQVPCAAEDDVASSNGSSSGVSSSKDRQQHRNKRDSTGGTDAAVNGPSASPVTATSHTSQPGAATARHGGPSAGAGGANRQGDDMASEVEVYTKYFHLVPAQALRKAFAALDGSESGAYFEDVLCAAEAAGSGSPLANPTRRVSVGAANGHAWVPGATAAGHPLATLLRFPSVFTLALVWESPQAPQDALRGTLEALGPKLDLALLFRCSAAGLAGGASGMAPGSAPCELRSVICYFGHHYLVFALSQELGLWLLLDDSNIQLVGHWADVVKLMCAKRLQPSLLFYEAVRQPLPAAASMPSGRLAAGSAQA